METFEGADGVTYFILTDEEFEQLEEILPVLPENNQITDFLRNSVEDHKKRKAVKALDENLEDLPDDKLEKLADRPSPFKGTSD